MNDVRDRVIEDVRRRIEALPFGYRVLLRQEADHRENDLSLAASTWCLAAGEALGGDALPQATALALLDLTNATLGALSFTGAAASSLQDSWGMPRALNGGDAAFALGQAAATEGARDAASTLAVASAYDAACRAASELLLGGDEAAYLRAAARLGAVAAGANAAQLESIVAAVDASVKVEDVAEAVAGSLKGGGA